MIKLHEANTTIRVRNQTIQTRQSDICLKQNKVAGDQESPATFISARKHYKLKVGQAVPHTHKRQNLHPNLLIVNNDKRKSIIQKTIQKRNQKKRNVTYAPQKTSKIKNTKVIGHGTVGGFKKAGSSVKRIAGKAYQAPKSLEQKVTSVNSSKLQRDEQSLEKELKRSMQIAKASIHVSVMAVKVSYKLMRIAIKTIRILIRLVIKFITMATTNPAGWFFILLGLIILFFFFMGQDMSEMGETNHYTATGSLIKQVIEKDYGEMVTEKREALLKENPTLHNSVKYIGLNNYGIPETDNALQILCVTVDRLRKPDGSAYESVNDVLTLFTGESSLAKAEEKLAIWASSGGKWENRNTPFCSHFRTLYAKYNLFMGEVRNIDQKQSVLLTCSSVKFDNHANVVNNRSDLYVPSDMDHRFSAKQHGLTIHEPAGKAANLFQQFLQYISPNFPPIDRSYRAKNNFGNWGQCTWYVYNRISQCGFEIPGNLGDARQWSTYAPRYGGKVSHTPRPGSIGCIQPGQLYVLHSAGHVIFCEAIETDGTVCYSEGNLNGEGAGDITEDRMSAGEAAQIEWINFFGN